MDMLKNDLRSIQGGLKELLSASSRKLSVPSWKFPSKQGDDVDIDEVLKNYAATEDGNDARHSQHFYLLELIVDRLLFLLQSCIALSDETLGQRSTNLPLTLGSTVKKFAKRMLQCRATVRDMKKKMSSKDATISSLTSLTTKLRENCALLERSHQPITDNESSGVTDGDLVLSRPSTSTGRCVPYEAMGTLKMTNFTTMPMEMQTSQKRNGLSATSTATASPSSPSGSQVPPRPPSQPSASVSTQTMDTAFALCARCSTTQDTLIQVADTVSFLCRDQGLQSSMNKVNWRELARVGGLELSKWREKLANDLSGVSEHCGRLKETVLALESEHDAHKLTVEKLENEIEQLSSQMDSLQESVEEIQRKNEVSLSKSRESFSSQLRQLEAARDRLEAKSLKMKDELNSARSQEAHLRSLVADLEHRRGQLQIELKAMHGREIQLVAAKQGLEEELRCSKTDLEAYRDRLESSQLELSKNKVYSHTLDKRNKSLQAKQANLLSRLDELDQDCAGLRDELHQVEGSRQELQKEVKDIQDHCNDLQQQLQAEQERLAQSHTEQEHLIKVVSELEGQLGEVRMQLDQEKHNCRLLMDYPFIKQVSGDYHSHVASLTSEDSQKQVSANTIRILLLEEQNSELREKGLPQREAKNRQSFQVLQATPLWRKTFLSQLQEEQMAAQQSSQALLMCKPQTSEAWSSISADQSSMNPYNDRHQQSLQNSFVGSISDTNSNGLVDHRRKNNADKRRTNLRVKSGGRRPSIEQPRASTAKLKGRLGHLVAAIAESHSSSSSPTASHTGIGAGSGGCVKTESSSHGHSNAWVSANNSIDSIEVQMCSKCDRMFSDRSDLEHHQASCVHVP